MASIAVNGISFGVGVDTILQNVTFSLEEGDRLGVVGVNGSGKSTLLKLLSGELEPDTGDIYTAKNSTVGILHQDDTFNIEEGAGESVLEQMYAAFPELLRLEMRIGELEEALKGETQWTSKAGEIHEVYGQKPVLSEEMEQFLETELRGTESSYEKLQRIESLLAGMQYTKKPGELPAEVDSAASFLDHLVLETKRGYCTHFATAFVLLARAEGIPARYVQGYTFPISSGLTEVMSNQAHAWPEAYIDGIGWIVFEPTPGFRKFSGWNVTDGKEEEGKDAYNPYDHYADKKENSSEYIENPKPAETDETIKWFSEKLYIPLLLTVLFLVVFIPADLLARRIRYVKLSDRKKVVYQFARILRVLKHIGLVSEDGETLSEFSARAENEIPEWNHAIFERYEDIIYGEQAVSSSDMKLFETGYKELLKIWIRRWRTKRIGKEASSETKE